MVAHFFFFQKRGTYKWYGLGRKCRSPCIPATKHDHYGFNKFEKRLICIQEICNHFCEDGTYVQPKSFEKKAVFLGAEAHEKNSDMTIS